MGAENFDAAGKSYVGWLIASKGLSVADANKRYGVPTSTLYDWKNLAIKGKMPNGKAILTLDKIEDLLHAYFEVRNNVDHKG